LSGADIKKAIADAGLKVWQVAYAYGVNDGNFSRKLRKDFSDAETEKILSIIDSLKKA
jgi:predicted XRE-type DNA-binding protein